MSAISVMGSGFTSDRFGYRQTITVKDLPHGGITVMRPGRYDVLRASLGRSAKHEGAVTTTDVPPELWSDDVTRGWRVDVLDRDSATLRNWLSLGERVGRYVFDGAPLAVDGKEFEAYVKSTSACPLKGGVNFLPASTDVIGGACVVWATATTLTLAPISAATT